jgi:hypothetical protein
MHKDCQTYNESDENELPKMSKKLVDSLKSDIRKQISVSDDLKDLKRSKYEEFKAVTTL